MNKENKGFLIVLIVLAVIGLLSLIGLGVFGLMKLVDKSKPEDYDSQIEETVELEDENILEGDGKNSSVEVTEALQEYVIPEVNVSVEEENVVLNENRLQIVFMGDSILDNFRDETGIVYLVGQAVDADVINLAIGGTCASIDRDDDNTNENWNSTSGAGVAKAVCGIVSPDVLFDCTAKNLIKAHMDDFKNTDIFVIEYGVNDFMFGRQRAAEDGWDPTTYVGALRHMMDAITKTYPDAKVVMCAPTYVEFYRDNGEYVGNTYTLNNGTGTEYDYIGKMENVANEYSAFFFAFEKNGITMENANETLLDGVHLSEAGRKIYAENLSEFIKDKVFGVND